MAEWLWPMPGYTKVSRSTEQSGHKGIDIVGNKGAAIIASKAGRVTRAEYSSSYGNVVYIDHGDGYQSRYAHMIQSPSVSYGQQVSQGTIVGYCGNTGDSQGYHLHFEIRLNDNPLEPKNFISPDNTTTPPAGIVSHSLNSDSAGSTSTYPTSENVPYTPLAIVGRRSIDVTAQPTHPYVNIWVGDTLLSTQPPKPNIIQNFSFYRIESAGSTAEFTIFDDDWDKIEKIFADNYKNIYIEYGYVNGITSERYHMLLANYHISFNFTGVILSIKAISESSVSNLQTQNISIKKGTTNPTDAIRQICNQMGWDAQDLVATENLNVDLASELSSVNEHPVTYILEEILPLISTEGEDTLHFYVDENNRAHLRKKTAAPSNIDDIKTYIFQKGYDSVVKDLSFDYEGVFGGVNLDPTGAVTGGRVGVIDTDTKETTEFEKTIADVGTTETTSHMTMESTQSVVNMEAAGYTARQMSRKLWYQLKNSMSMSFTGTMTIMGDPSIELLDHIRLVNITDSGDLHHTSGIYMVVGITTSFSGGEMYTSLKLTRFGDINQGVELINAKYYVK